MAAGSLQHLLRIAQTWEQAHLQIVGNMYLAQLALASGDLAAAGQALLKAERLVKQERLAIDAGAVVATRVQYWLAAGNLVAASSWASHVVFSPESWDPCRGHFLQAGKRQIGCFAASAQESTFRMVIISA